jgi:hypothetical protein
VAPVFLDPSFEEAPAITALPARPKSLRGATVGFISNGKAGTRVFFDHLERMLRDEWGVAGVVRLTKSNYSAPAERDVIDVAAGWAALFAGVGD